MERVKIEDLFILPFFTWTWNKETQTTDKKATGWHAYSISTKGTPDLPIPPGTGIGMSPHDNELFPTPEAAFEAAKAYRIDKERKENGEQADDKTRVDGRTNQSN